MDKFEHRFQGNPEYHILLLPVEAALPRMPDEEDKNKSQQEEAINEESEKKHRVSREELYSEINEGRNIESVFLAMTILSFFYNVCHAHFNITSYKLQNRMKDNCMNGF